MSAHALRLSDAFGEARARLAALSLEEGLWWTFRIAVAMCYIGHGAFGVLTKAEWIPFFALVGIPADVAVRLMPLIGSVDIALGLWALVSPRRVVLLHMTLWSIWTAALRPLVGLSVFEMIERAGNYGVPLAFLFLLGPARTLRDWLVRPELPALTPPRTLLLRRTLAWTTALLLVGHGGLAAIERKAQLAEHAAAIGLGAPAAVAAGYAEIGMAVAVVLCPGTRLLLAIAAWKIGTEALFPIAGAPAWEWIERGGSYAAPLALAMILAADRRGERASRRRPASRALAVPAVLALLALPAAAVPARAQDEGPPPSLADELRRGGYLIVMRHARTDHDQHDRGPDRASQRNLTAEGEEQARRVGRELRALGIPIGRVSANPMYRNRETAELAFGRTEVDSALAGRGAAAYLRSLAATPVPSGTNRVVVTRTGIILGAFEQEDPGPVVEGGALVVRPLGEGKLRIVAKLGADDWISLAARPAGR